MWTQILDDYNHFSKTDWYIDFYKPYLFVETFYLLTKHK